MNTKPLWAWMTEREAIRERRERGVPAHDWTRDPIFATYRFCNVNREHDRVTTWIREWWREPYEWDARLWWAMCVARQFNYIPTLEALEFPVKHDRASMIWALDQRNLAGQQIYGNAYMIHPPQSGSRYRKMPKHYYTVDVALLPLRTQRPDFASVERFTNWLAEFPEWGLFMAYEVASDLVQTKWLANARDTETWANVGPGARRGLLRLLGHDVRATLSQTDALAMARKLYASCPLDFVTSLRDIEHSLCEFDKYERAREGRASLRRYRPEEALT